MDEKNNFENENSPKPEKRSIRNIPLSKKQTKELEEIEEEISEGVMPPPPIMPPMPTEARATATRPRTTRTRKVDSTDESTGTTRTSRRLRRRGGMTWFVLAVIVLVIIYGVGHVFAKATVSIRRTQEVILLTNNSFPLTSNSSTSSTAIKYQTATLNLTASTTISASGQQTVQKKASGKVVVYNDSTTSQLLIATTRLQTPEGLIFRVNTDVTVPAKKNVTISVTADQPGEKYNIGLKTFTLPGLQGTAKYKTVYAKSSTSMTGGSISTVPQTSSSDLSSAKGALQNDLQEQASEQTAAQIPEGYVLVDGSQAITYGTVKQTYSSASKQAILTQNATAVVYYLEKSSMSSAVATKSTIFAIATDTSSAIIDTQSLTVSFPNSSKPTSIMLTGTSTVESSFDSDKITTTIAKADRKTALNYIESLPGVQTAEVSIEPWWEFKLPKASSIKVEIQ